MTVDAAENVFEIGQGIDVHGMADLDQAWITVMLSGHEKSSRKRFRNRSEWFVEIPGKMGLGRVLMFKRL